MAVTDERLRQAGTATFKIVVGLTYRDVKLHEVGSGQVGFSPSEGQIAFDLQTGSGPSSLTMRFIGTDLYVGLSPAERSANGVHTPWVQTRLSAGGIGGPIGAIDFSEYAMLVATRSSHVSQVGTESLFGVNVTHYKASMDLTSVDSADRAALPQVLQLASIPGVGGALPVDVWIDQLGRPRQLVIREHFDRPPPGDTADASLFPVRATITLTFPSFGAALAVTPPPADQVTSMTPEQFQRLGSGSG